MEYTNEILMTAAGLFVAGEIDNISLIDKSEREDDLRMIAQLVAHGEKYVLKMASNAFTTSRRIAGWAKMIDASRSLGAYMPRLILSIRGNLSEAVEYEGHSFVVWCEEFAPFSSAGAYGDGAEEKFERAETSRPKSSDGTPVWREELVDHYSKIAAARVPGGWGVSGYSRFIPFDGDETDEVEECVIKFGIAIEERFSALAERWREVRALWDKNREELAKIYPRLPKSVFQADWNRTNVLLTDEGHFAGLIDFNIAGEDTALNIALSCDLLQKGDLAPPDESYAPKTLRAFARNYKWNGVEIEAAPYLWRYITALYWGEVNDIRCAEDAQAASLVLDRIEKQLTAKFDFREAMAFVGRGKKTELWDAYDRELNRIEGMTLIRGERIPEGVYHLVSDVIVRHEDGEYLLMQRDPRKHYGGMWEATAGGSALAGETAFECAVRELREETGIASRELTEVGKDVSADTIYVEFLCVTDCAKDCVTLQEGETSAYKWVTREELLEMKSSELVTKRMQIFVEELKSSGDRNEA